MPADIRLGDVRAWEIDDVPGLRLYVAIPKGKLMPQMWFEIGGRRVQLARFLGPGEGQQFADFLDMMVNQINRAMAARLTETRDDDTENEAGRPGATEPHGPDRPRPDEGAGNE